MAADEPPPVHTRRPRYAGKNPRRFHEKYKELDPERYDADVRKILESGKTPAGMHRPIMVAELLAALAPAAGELAVDCTLGFGGHARAILDRIQPGGSPRSSPAGRTWCSPISASRRCSSTTRSAGSPIGSQVRSTCG